MATIYTALSMTKMAANSRKQYETYAGGPAPPFPSKRECDDRRAESVRRLKASFRVDVRTPEEQETFLLCYNTFQGGCNIFEMHGKRKSDFLYPGPYKCNQG